MRLRILLFVIFLLMVTAIPAVLADDASNALTQPFKEEILEAVNALRNSYGCGSLTFDEHLNSAAQHQAEYLAQIGRLENTGPAGESPAERAADAGYGGDKSFTIHETNAQIWVDTDTTYLVEQIWRKNQPSVRVMFDQAVRQAGIGVADAPDKHRYVVLTVAGLDDGTNDYSMTRPTYDVRTPKPTMSATPSPQPLITSTRNPDGGVYHVVQEGETFSEIALAYGLDWYTLSVRNHITLSDTTPVVIMEGQVLVIEPTYTLTPTPTPTKTPVPPTNTPRPTFTPRADAADAVSPTPLARPVPNFRRLLDNMAGWKKTVGWILIGISVPGILLSLRRKK